MRFATKALHSKYPKKEAYGALRFPIYLNAAFEFENGDEIESVFKGGKKGHTYTRASNPTVEELESKVQLLSGGYGAVATASGMAAISNTLLALLKSGDSIVVSKYLFGHTYSLFKTLFADFGVDVRFVDICDIDEVSSAISSSTKALFVETISNPQLSIPDFSALSTLAKGHNMLLIADTTLTPWNIFDAKKFGVDIEVVSATKYLSGGGSVVGGLIIDTGNANWEKYKNLQNYYERVGKGAFVTKLRKESFRNLGASLSPQSAYMLSLGLETLELRVEKSSENAMQIAEELLKVDGVASVNYPFLECSSCCKMAKKQFSSGGSILTFTLANKDKAYRFLDALTFIRRSTNIQDNKTLAIAPYHTIYAEYKEDERVASKLHPGMVRLSVGIEDGVDLINEVSSALKAAV